MQRTRIFAAPVVGFAIVVVWYGAYGLLEVPPASWTLVFTVIASVIICGPFQIPIGRGRDFPRLGVPITMLAIRPSDESPYLGVCVWAIGLAASQMLLQRNPVRALYNAGLGSAAAFAFTAVRIGLTSLGLWLLLSLVLATAVYYALFLLGDFAYRRVRLGRRAPGLSTLSPTRIGAVVLLVAVTSALMDYFDSTVVPWLEHDPDASLAPFVVLLAASLFYVFAQRTRYGENERRLTAIVDAAVELPRESGEELASALRDRSRAIVQADEVELRSTPPESHEIGTEVHLEPGADRYLVASHKIGGGHFTREDEQAIGILAHVASDAARARREVDALERRANSDPLTGLPNYGAFQQALIEANENRAYHEGIALLFIDFDGFKKLNDTFGHQVGDELLRAVADRLQSAAGGGDFVSRIGGDEFTVILSDLVSIEQARESADRIIERVSQPLLLEGHRIRPAVSAGLAFSSHRELDAQTLVEDADRTMLKAKRSRRRDGAQEGSVVSVSSHRSTRTNDIVARAITEGRLFLAFQPIVSIDEHRIWAFEALVRYVDPELGPISPPSLVARAKGLGLMNELTRQVIEKALDAAEEFHRLETGIDCVTVNLELDQIGDGELGPFIREAASAHPDVSLCIELNERSLRSVTDELQRAAEAMQESGVRIALDDYGSDDSPVSALVRFPMDILKIDKSLIDDLDDVRQREVIRALRRFGDNLGCTMVVEGVETASAVEILAELGVRSVQGYYFGKPLSFAQTMNRLRRSGARARVDS
ncbi:MAG: EAL domain-containing protein [Leucobacter sp.]